MDVTATIGIKGTEGSHGVRTLFSMVWMTAHLMQGKQAAIEARHFIKWRQAVARAFQGEASH